ncbi:calcium-dependent phosphotriesterase [Dothidotthia symphoricarpi CBS 119687]|uniref:Calcium-dependent phosphotriesterase n=1 Tax=Dothidotthia symphoricarpi CBS 119687 TaxID=1392245 RepID=A0A6A6AKC7_9PLEO|nr:calcium-dependent phosphotriesterase [Dothidotthia symphoricarpi CBS 119687]KAF2132412.1 calcium-dependent phosphotriesterase [Dothidotthia symphoricarpi CBS 119687]
MAKSAIYLLILAALSPWLYDRYQAISTVVANRPGKFRGLYNIKSHEIKFQDQIRNCEDVIIEDGIAFLSCDPGRDRWNTVMGTFAPEDRERRGTDGGDIWIYDYSRPDLPDSEALKRLSLSDYADPVDFHPLGIEFDAATSTLYVINHSRYSGSVIEVFQVSVESAVAKHVQTFKHPLVNTPNSIHSLGDGKLLVTNDHYMRAAVSPVLSKIETFSGISGGSVVYTDIHNPNDTRVVARVPFANGIAMFNSTTVAVASSSLPGIYFYTIDLDHRLALQRYVRTPVGVDNLSVDSDGKLLVAGHPFAFSLMKVSKGRPNCVLDGNEAEKKACECSAPSWAAEWSEKEGLKELYKNSSEEFCSSSTVVRDVNRNVGIISGLYEKGVFVFRE